MNPPPNGFVSNRVLKLKVGFLFSQSLGTSREFTFDIPEIAVADDLQLAFLRGTVRLIRTTEGILLQGSLTTALDGVCGRCLTDIHIPINLDLEELYALSPANNQEFVIGDDGVVDLTPLLREEIILHTPLAPLCKEDCAGLCVQCGHNLNHGPCSCDLNDIDPRFAILLQLRNQE